MKKGILIGLFGLLLGVFAVPARANQRAYGFCTVGGQTATVVGIAVSPQVQASYPQCTVTVYNTGTLVLATIYSDNVLTPLGNPFVANSNGYWDFYAANGRYDVQLSGGGFPSPVTYGDVFCFDQVNFLGTANLWTAAQTFGPVTFNASIVFTQQTTFNSVLPIFNVGFLTNGLFPTAGTIGAAPIGDTLDPFGSVTVGLFANQVTRLTSAASVVRAVVFPDLAGTVTLVVSSGTSTLAAGAITQQTCAAVVTTAAAGVLAATDGIEWAFASAPTTADGSLNYTWYVTANNVNWKVCNTSAAPLTASGLVINWRVVR